MIVRDIDSLGRICVPISMRRMLDMGINSPVAIWVQDDIVHIKKYTDQGTVCHVCNTKDDVIDLGDYSICRSCAKELVNKCG